MHLLSDSVLNTFEKYKVLSMRHLNAALKLITNKISVIYLPSAKFVNHSTAFNTRTLKFLAPLNWWLNIHCFEYTRPPVISRPES